MTICAVAAIARGAVNRQKPAGRAPSGGYLAAILAISLFTGISMSADKLAGIVCSWRPEMRRNHSQATIAAGT